MGCSSARYLRAHTHSQVDCAGVSALKYRTSAPGFMAHPSQRDTQPSTRQHTRRVPPTHPQRDRPRDGVVDGSPSAQRTWSTARRSPGSGGAAPLSLAESAFSSKCVRHFTPFRDVKSPWAVLDGSARFVFSQFVCRNIEPHRCLGSSFGVRQDRIFRQLDETRYFKARVLEVRHSFSNNHHQSVF